MTTILSLSQSRLTVAFVGGRQAAGTTESFLYVTDCVEPVLYLALCGRRHGRLGYAVLELVREEVAFPVRKGLYELTQLLSADSSCPGPVAVLSGVLWSRLEVLEQLSAEPTFPVLELGLSELCGPRSIAGAFPRET